MLIKCIKGIGDEYIGPLVFSGESKGVWERVRVRKRVVELVRVKRMEEKRGVYIKWIREK